MPEARIAFAGTILERFAILVGIAQKLYSDAPLPVAKWRRDFAQDVARETQGTTEQRVYDWMAVLSPEKLSQLRVLCIGTVAARQILLERQRNLLPRKKKSPTEPKVISKRGDAEAKRDAEHTTALLTKADQEFLLAVNGLPEERRTRANVALALRRHIDAVDSYLFLHKEIAAMLSDGDRLFKKA